MTGRTTTTTTTTTERTHDWRVQIVLPGVVLQLASRREPRLRSILEIARALHPLATHKGETYDQQAHDGDGHTRRRQC